VALETGSGHQTIKAADDCRCDFSSFAHRSENLANQHGGRHTNGAVFAHENSAQTVEKRSKGQLLRSAVSVVVPPMVSVTVPV
jgi:hypothetical protein